MAGRAERQPRVDAPTPSARVGAYGGIVLDRLARHTCRIASVAWSCLFVRDKYDPRLVIAAAGHGVGWDLIGCRFGADEGAVGRVLLSGQPQLVEDHRELGGPVASEDGRAHPGAAVPIRCGSRVEGVLAVAMRTSKRPFGRDDLELLSELAELAGAALEHTRPGDRIDSAVQAHVQALAAAMDMRDRRTACHSEDVVDLARRVGELLELEPASLLELEFAARLHDVGKIRVPDAVLHKAGPLEPAESEVIRGHPSWGADTLAAIPGLEAVATIVRYHHERWDGRGYPQGLSGARIPLASRIISVCDSYGAMTSDRPYRRALPREEALAELRAGSGGQFDPAVVDALLEVISGD